MRLPASLASLLLCLGISHALAEPVTVRTFGYGSTASAAVADAQRQALADARDAARGPHTDQAADNQARLLEPARIIRTERRSTGQYEVEVIARVALGDRNDAAAQRRVAFLIDPRAPENLQGLRVVDAARERLAATEELVVAQDLEGKALRLLERVREHRGEAGIPFTDPGFDFLLVLFPETPAVTLAASEARLFKARLTFIEATTGKIRSITSVRTLPASPSADDGAAFVQDLGRQVAATARQEIDRLSPAAQRTRVISASADHRRFHVGQQVSVVRINEAGERTTVTLGEIIALHGSSARVWLERPLPQSGRYALRPLFKHSPNGIILDSDW